MATYGFKKYWSTHAHPKGSSSGYGKYWSHHAHPKGSASGFSKYWSKHTHPKGGKSGWSKWRAKHPGLHTGWGSHKHRQVRPRVTKYHAKQHRSLRTAHVMRVHTPHRTPIRIHRLHVSKGHSHISRLKLYKAYVF